VKAIREALGMSEFELAQRMGMSQPGVNRLQRAEVDESIKLSTLRRAGAALNCDLVYYLSPKEPLETMVWRQAFVKAAEDADYDPDDADDDQKSVDKGELAEALTPFWVDRRGLWGKRIAPQSDVLSGQPPASAAPVPPGPSLELWLGLP
jgi:predicted DNA-binding mobile mystery protein A